MDTHFSVTVFPGSHPISPPLLRTPFLLILAHGKAIVKGSRPWSQHGLGSWLALISNTHWCIVPFPQCPFNHNLDMFKARPRTGGEANDPSLPATASPAHNNGKPFRQITRKGQTHNENHISPGLLLHLLHYPFSFILKTQGNHILSLHQGSLIQC